jgi:hypothetical protein
MLDYSHSTYYTCSIASQQSSSRRRKEEAARVLEQLSRYIPQLIRLYSPQATEV